MPKYTFGNSFRFGSRRETITNFESIEKILKKLTKDWLGQFASQEKIQAELIGWKEMLVKINEVLDDAVKKQTKNELVKKWLDKLRNLAYDVDYLLDEFQTDAFQRMLLQDDVASKVKGINARLQDIASQIELLDLRKRSEGAPGTDRYRKKVPKFTLNNSPRFGSQRETITNFHSESIDMILKKLTKDWLGQFARGEQIQTDLIGWKKMLVKINEVLDDAMEKQMEEESVEKWLGKLRDLACDVDYLLDEFQTEAFQRMLLQEDVADAVDKSDASMAMSKVKEVNARLQAIASQIELLDLRKRSGGKSGNIRRVILSAVRLGRGGRDPGAAILSAVNDSKFTNLAITPTAATLLHSKADPSASFSGDADANPLVVTIVAQEPDILFSGCGKSFLTGSRTAKFSYGYSSFNGKNSSMEEFCEASLSEVDGQKVAFFGVYDGHGGSRTAEYLRNHLFKNLSSRPDFIKDIKTAIVEVFRKSDENYLSEEKGQHGDAGSTASTAVLLGDRQVVANVGDSRVVASRAGSAIPLIEDAGGFVIWAGTWRVGGVLPISRAFGDKLLKQYVVAEPEIQEEEIDGIDFIIVASDGLWNVISNEEAVAMVEHITDAEAASRKLITDAYARGSSDNITCVVVRFENSRPDT
ncbi:hypothetical protein CUMW_084250 [Citrus unshiu]|nr:hypothetical protein CUMW_084250 [Citrus unshiu]